MGVSRAKGSDQIFAKLEGHKLNEETSKSKYFSSRIIQNNLTQRMKGLALTVVTCGKGNENENLVSNKFLRVKFTFDERLTFETRFVI